MRGSTHALARGYSAWLDPRQTTVARYKLAMPQFILEDFNLENAERRLCIEALERAGNIVGAAKLLGITRHAMKRRIIKLRLDWTRGAAPPRTPSSGSTGPS
ncbi:helix-turn-helix domain-containing protein [Nannocystis pusilla]|uniref:helix-turn-helix domain-containing protein n=1 Tax=Nannocystis pusilla TaxID=889268 RepID=UPI003BF032AB